MNKLKILYAQFVSFFVGYIFISLFLFPGYSSNSLLFLASYTICVFAIPHLISKAIFQKDFFSFFSAVSYLYFPFIFISEYVLVNNFSVQIDNFSILFSVVFFYILNIYYLASREVNDFAVDVKSTINYLPLLVMLPVLFVLLRPEVGVLSMDQFQHQNVVNKLLSHHKPCVFPDDCSNLFLIRGYSNFFHTIQAVLTNYGVFSMLKSFFVIDFVWSTFASLVFYKIATKFSKLDYLSKIVITLLAFSVFINGAYDFKFFIPQSFVLFIFLNIISEKSLSLTKLIIGIALLNSLHFAIGPYLSIMLVLYHILNIDNVFRLVGIFKYPIALSFILLSLLAAKELTIENIVQQESLDIIGSNTNQEFIIHLKYLLKYYGVLIVALPLGLIEIIKFRINRRLLVVSALFIYIGLVIYLLRPTYAYKFLLGSSIFFSIVLVIYINQMFTSFAIKYFLYLILILASLSILFINFNEYVRFYQYDGTPSLIGQNDIELANNLEDRKCLYISDPYTQIIISGQTDLDTVRAQYMKIETRKAFVSFLNDPTTENLKYLKNSDDVFKEKELCLVYSSKLDYSIKLKNFFWTENIYGYPIIERERIEPSKELLKFYESKGYTYKIINEDYGLFSKK